MTTTQNLHLPQWEDTDRIMRTDFNDAMAKLDTAVAAAGNAAAAAPRIATGSYNGNGASGSNSPISLDFGFQPKLFILCGYGASYSSAVVLRGSRYYSNPPENSTTVFEWLENGISWYGSNDGAQFNRSNTTYFYMAIA